MSTTTDPNFDIRGRFKGDTPVRLELDRKKIIADNFTMEDYHAPDYPDQFEQAVVLKEPVLNDAYKYIISVDFDLPV